MKVEMKGIHKAFGANKVLEGVDFTLESGEVHALMGENGAGKSTLMNMLTGLLKVDKGQIFIDGEETYYESVKIAEMNGVSFIHQEMNNFSEMTVLDNMYMNREIKNKLGVIQENKMRKNAQQYLGQLGADIDLNTEIGSLSVGKQQMIEIAKSLMSDAKVIIMDEPTAALTEKEINSLFEIIRKLQKKGVSIVYISHRMEEIFEICDRVTVMRDGISISTYKISETNMQQIVHDMVGRELNDFYPDRNPKLGDEFFKVEHLTGKGKFEDINFDVKSGEILAFSGLMGAGRTEIMRSIFGIDPITSGDVFIKGKKVHIKDPQDAINKGIGFLTENRKDEGLILDFSLSDNIVLPSVKGFVKHGIVDTKSESDFVDMLMKRLNVKAMNAGVTAGSLSGGNQQKVVLAKWIGTGPQVLILDEPTRGIDVGAKREIYNLMNELTDRGVAIIMISSDLPEVLGMSDRIAVIHEGNLKGIVNTKQATQESVMALATGGSKNG